MIKFVLKEIRREKNDFWKYNFSRNLHVFEYHIFEFSEFETDFYGNLHRMYFR